jgi:hypothetical protein
MSPHGVTSNLRFIVTVLESGRFFGSGRFRFDTF